MALGNIEEHGFVKLWPLEVEAFLHSVRWKKEEMVRGSLSGWKQGKKALSQRQDYFFFPFGLRSHLTSSDTVLQRALVEDVGGEGAEGGVHAVLDLQTDWPDSQNHQALKKRLRKSCFGRLLAHDHRAQLTVVTHQDQLQEGIDRRKHSFYTTDK